MDKQNEIEEMAKELCPHYDNGNCYYEVTEVCDCCCCCEFCWAVSQVLNAGYRKIPENAVVLTDKELYEELNACKVAMIVHDDDGEKYVSLDDYNEYTERLAKIASQRKERIEQLEKLLDDRCDHCIERERKETAEKFADRVKEETDHGISALYDSTVDEICKELTEGKNGN